VLWGSCEEYGMTEEDKAHAEKKKSRKGTKK
jgi:hypothetical protein